MIGNGLQLFTYYTPLISR